MRRTFALIALATAWGPLAALAQPPPAPQPTVITIRPAAEPVPALKYRLVPERSRLVRGNAAIFYHRAIHLLTLKRPHLAGKEKGQPGGNSGPVGESAIVQWSSGSISEIPREEARKQLEPFQGVLKEIELGAQRLTCDWEYDQRDEGFTLLIPEIQEMRSLARLVAVRTRLAVLDGNTDEAMRWIEIGLVMGRHVSQGPIVIQALVGIAICNLMEHCLEELIDTPGTPSLYWAFADRPRPFIDMRTAMEGERYLLEKEIPELNELDRGPWSPDQARQFADALQLKLFTFASGSPPPSTAGAGPTNLSSMSRRLGIAAMATKIYPEAKRALIARGRPEGQVEAMPVIQVAALYTLQNYQRLRDDSYKWMGLPYWQSFDKVNAMSRPAAEDKFANPLLTLFQTLTPALNSARLAPVLLDRRLNALQCIEAIRLHVAGHGGKLPTSLGAITEAPAPADPVTGKPFLYEVNGDSAVLSGPMAPGFNHHTYAIRYELKLVK